MYKSMMRMAPRRPILSAQLAAQNPVTRMRVYAKPPMPPGPQIASNPAARYYPYPVYTAPTTSRSTGPRHSGVYRALTASDRVYLSDRANHMRNVFFSFNPASAWILTPDQIALIAGMAATGLLGDDGDAGTKKARKFAQAMEFASNWLETHQFGAAPTPYG